MVTVNELFVVKSRCGKWKAKQREKYEDTSGLKYCTSCKTLRPKETVKIYKSLKGNVGMARCSYCQGKRLERLKELGQIKDG